MPGLFDQIAQASAAANQGGGGLQRAGGYRQRIQPPRLSLATPLHFVMFLVLNAIGIWWLIAHPMGLVPGIVGMVAAFVLSIILIRVVNIAAQWERGVLLRLGRYKGMRGPGIILIFPMIDYLKIVDTRTQTLEIPQQQVITRDNVPISINGVLYFKVVDVGKAVTLIQDYEFGILQYAQAALRDVIGRLTLDELLAERDQIQKEIEIAVEKSAQGWGLDVDALRLQDIDMPEDLKKMMSRQASAEREKRANITKAEGDKLAALNLAEAANTMFASPGAMQLRTLQTIDSLGPSASNTVVLAVPTEIFTMARAVTDALVRK